MKRTKLHKMALAALLFLPLFFASCRRDNNQIPNVLVDISVNINNPGYYQLQAVGGWMYFEGGSRGILVFRRSQDEFMAFERHCPYQPQDNCGRVEVDTSNQVIAFDPCCNSRFLMTDGSLQSGPAPYGLKTYQVSFDGSQILRIYN